MLNILLVVHVVIAALLIAVILLQRNSSDALAGLSGGGNNMGLVSARGAANFMTKLTIILATAFMINSLILANLSNKSASRNDANGLTEQLENKQGNANTKAGSKDSNAKGSNSKDSNSKDSVAKIPMAE